jgi:excisionase family DNA binding protein
MGEAHNYLSREYSLLFRVKTLSCKWKGVIEMDVYTLKEAARVTKIGMETLRRACQEGLIKAVRLPNGEYRITDTALEQALSRGLDLQALSRQRKKKRPQPEPLRRALEARRHARAHDGE